MGVKVRKRMRAKKEALFLDIYHQGKRKFEYLGLFLTDDKSHNRDVMKLAEMQRAKRELDLQYADFGFVSDTRKKENFVEYFDKLVKARTADRSSWACTLKKLKTFSDGNIRFDHITPEWLEDFQKYLLSEISQITAWHYYSNIRHALNRATREKIINTNPCTLIKGIKKPEVKREYLTIDEIKTLSKTECGNKEIKDAFLFSCFTGLRLSDVRSLKWNNIVGDRIEFTQQKTRSIEYLPLSKTALQIVTEKKTINSEKEYVFDLPDKTVIWGNIKRWVEKAKINKRVSFHTGRHSFATMALTEGVDLYTVSKLLGHKDISTTQIYAKIVDSKKLEAVNKLPVL